MLPPLPSVPTLLNEPDMLVACHSVVRTGKVYNHSEEKLPRVGIATVDVCTPPTS